jgi:hypothetical protein
MAIKIKNRAPKSTDLKKDDIIVNIKEGALYFKSELGVHRLVSEVQTPHTPDYGPHPIIDLSPYALLNHVHPPPTITNYFHTHWSADWGSKITENAINFTTTSENVTIGKDRMFLMPHSGILHKLYWKQTGTCSDVTIKLYQNINDEGATIAGAINNTPVVTVANHVTNIGTGSGGEYGNINTVDLNFIFNAGDHIVISLQAATDGIRQITGQLLYSQTITI